MQNTRPFYLTIVKTILLIENEFAVENIDLKFENCLPWFDLKWNTLRGRQFPCNTFLLLNSFNTGFTKTGKKLFLFSIFFRRRLLCRGVLWLLFWSRIQWLLRCLAQSFIRSACLILSHSQQIKKCPEDFPFLRLFAVNYDTVLRHVGCPGLNYTLCWVSRIFREHPFLYRCGWDYGRMVAMSSNKCERWHPEGTSSLDGCQRGTLKCIFSWYLL